MKEDMSLKERNTWWKKAIGKEALRNENKPKAKSPFVPVNISTFAPEKKGGTNARSRRSR